MAAHAKNSFVEDAFRRLGRFCFLNPRPVLFGAVFLAAISVGYTYQKLGMHTDRSDLIGGSEEHNKRFLEFEKEFGAQGDIVLVVESDREEKNREYVEELVHRLKANPDLFGEILYKFDLNFLGQYALQFIPEDKLKDLADALHEFHPSLEQFVAVNDFESLFHSINREFLNAGQGEKEGKRLLKSLPALRRIVTQIRHSLTARNPSLSPEIEMIMGEPSEVLNELYLTLQHGQIFLVTIKWKPFRQDFTPGSTSVDMIRQIAKDLRHDYPAINVGITGDPVLEYDEMNSATSSMNWASWISLALVVGMFVYAYRRLYHPFFTMVTLLIAVAWTFGFTTLAVGHLNILTITFVPILIGLGVDHGIHIISRYEEELTGGAKRLDALETAMGKAGVGVLTGALTMAGAFFAIIFTHFEGIREMGKITGGGVLLSCLAMLTVLPALLSLEKKSKPHRSTPENLGTTRAFIEATLLKSPGLTVLGALVLSLISLVTIWGIGFDYNLLRMQDQTLNSVIYENKIVNSKERSVLYATTDCSTLEEARALSHAFLLKKDTVAEVRSVADFFQGNPLDKLELIHQVKADLRNVQAPAGLPKPMVLEELEHRFRSLSALMDLAEKDLAKAAQEEQDPKERAILEQADQDSKDLILALDTILVDFRTLDRSLVQNNLTLYQQAFFTRLHETFELIRNQEDSRPARIMDIPKQIREIFVGKTGRLMVQIYPSHNIWERQPLERFIQDVRSVRPEVTGIPITQYEYTAVLRDSYLMAALYALVAVIFLAYLHFRSWQLVLLSLVPLFAGIVWMLGWMGLINIQFNPANIMTLPLVVGIGVVNGIQILHRAREEKSAILFSKSTGKAVLLTSLTTLAGFGSLMVATHPGIASLGLVMSIGLVTCLVATVVLVPALISIFQKKNWKI